MKELYKIIKEGLAIARFGCVLGSDVIAPGFEPIRLEAEDGDEDLGGEEFLVKPFRFLSKALTPYRFFDFTREGVLEGGVPLFDRLTVYANHNADVNQWKGYTQKPVWDSENDPNGINGLMILDRTVDSNLARGVEIGALRSASVTIWFEYERSHPDLRNFCDYLGEEVDGEIVRFIVTKLVKAGEVSIVWEGEDPYAKALMAAAQDIETNQNKGGDETMQLTAEFLKMLSITASEDGEVSPETLEAAVEQKLVEMTQQLEGLKVDAEIGKKHLQGLREKAVTLYKALKGEDAKENYIENVILKADLETAQALVDEYRAGVEETVPLACPQCGEKLARQSSVASGQGESKGGKRAEDYKLG